MRSLRDKRAHAHALLSPVIVTVSSGQASVIQLGYANGSRPRYIDSDFGVVFTSFALIVGLLSLL